MGSPDHDLGNVPEHTFLRGYWAAGGANPVPSGLHLLQAQANTALATVVQAQAASANMGSVGRAASLDALTALRLNNILNAVFQTIMGAGPAFPLAPQDVPFYRALLNESDLSLVASLAGVGAIRGLIGRLAALGVQASDPPSTPQPPPAPGRAGCVFCGGTQQTGLFRGQPVCRPCREQLQGDS